jgi:hypothetical protein
METVAVHAPGRKTVSGAMETTSDWLVRSVNRTGSVGSGVLEPVFPSVI